MNASYCPSCYRDLPPDAMCPSCAERRTLAQPAARLSLWIGAAGVPLLIFGLLAPSFHACVAGAFLSGSAALAHVVILLRSD